jgi:hypothetical protein
MNSTLNNNTNAVSVASTEAKPHSKTLTTRFLAWIAAQSFLLLLTVVAFTVRLVTAPPFVESRDGLFFIRGLEKYSVADLRPQWPGYPVYLWFGKLFQVLFQQADGVAAFHLLSALASVLIIWPLASTSVGWGRDHQASTSKLTGWGTALVWLVVPLAWIDGTEIFSDPLALLFALTMLWLCWQAIESKKIQLQTGRPSYGFVLGAAGVAGFMLGIRLSYLALLLPLVYAVWQYRKDALKLGKFPLKINLLVVAACCLGLPILCWLGWQWLMEGPKFVQAAFTHLDGHYSEWGGSVTTDHQVLTRPVRLLQTVVVYGIGAWWPGTPLLRLGATAALAILVGRGSWRLFKNTNHTPLILAVLWLLPYGLWILLGNDVDLARYDFPFIALICLLAGLGLPTNVTSKTRYIKPKFIPVLVLGCVVILVGAVSVPLALNHHTNPPIGDKLADFANRRLPQPQAAQVFIADNISPMVFFMLYQAPTVQIRRATDDALLSQVLQLSQTYPVYLATTTPPTAMPENWVEVTNFVRNPYLESRGPLQVWFYQYQNLHSSTQN